MNGAHLHLLLNHIPVIGTAFALLLLGFGMGRKSEEIKKAALGMLVLVALASIGAFLTGEPAEDAIKGVAGISTSLVHPHEEAAELALWASIIVGVAALGSLIWFRGAKPIKQLAASVVLAGAVIVTALMVYVAFQGGKIRHTEFHQAASQALRT